MGERWARVVARRRGWVFGLGLVMLCLAVAGATRVRIDDSLGAFFDDSHPSYRDFARYEDAFGSNKQILVLLEAEDVFAPAVLQLVQAYSEELASSKRVDLSEVVSLTSVTDVVPTEDGFEMRPVIAALPAGPEEQRALRERVLGGPLVEAGLVSSDGTATAVVARLRRTGVELDAETQGVVLETLRELVAKHRPAEGTGIAVHLVGAGELEEALRSGIQRENLVFWPVTVLVLFALMVRLTGGWASASFSLVSVAGSLLLMLAAMAVTGVSLDFVTVMLPVVVLTVGVADAIHIVSHFRTALTRHRDREQALAEALRRVFRPCLVAMITTVMGFGSLLLSEQVPVRNFGGFAALGIAVAFLVNVTLLPALLLARPPRGEERTNEGLRNALDRFQRATSGSPLLTLALVAFGCAVGALGYLRIETGINSRHFFRDPVPELAALDLAERKLGGARSIELLLEGEPGQMLEPELLAWLVGFEAAAREEPLVQGSASLLTVFGRVSTALGTEPGTLPAEAAAAHRSLFLYEMGGGGSDLRRWVDYEANSTTRVSLRHAMANSTELVELVGRLEERLEAAPPPDGVRATFTGQGVVASQISEAARKTLVDSFGISFVAIFLTLVILVRSPLLAAFAMIPNVVPVLLGVGLLGWLRIPLDALTATVACVGLGIAVNDTMHFVEGFLGEQRAGHLAPAAISRTMRSVAVPMVHTTVVLACGLAVLMLGRFQPTVNMGAVLTIIVLVALVSDLALLPALLRLWARDASVPRTDRPESLGVGMETGR